MSGWLNPPVSPQSHPQEDKDMINRLVLEEMGSSLGFKVTWLGEELENEEIRYPFDSGSWEEAAIWLTQQHGGFILPK